MKDKPQLGFALIVQLTGVNGSQQFDRLTKTKIVESILASLDADGVASYVEYLVAQTNDSEGQRWSKILLSSTFCSDPLAPTPRPLTDDVLGSLNKWVLSLVMERSPNMNHGLYPCSTG